MKMIKAGIVIFFIVSTGGTISVFYKLKSKYPNLVEDMMMYRSVEFGDLCLFLVVDIVSVIVLHVLTNRRET